MPESFKPIVNMESEILILGTLPGVVSLQKQQYYGHPRNQFWPIIYDVFDSEIQVDYEDKCNFLLKNKIALWDIVGKANREGALDRAIRDVEPNDIAGLFKEYPGITTIIFNGKDPEKYFKKFFPDLYINKKCIRVSSTSPIPGKYIKSLSKKKQEWRDSILKGISA